MSEKVYDGEIIDFEEYLKEKEIPEKSNHAATKKKRSKKSKKQETTNESVTPDQIMNAFKKFDKFLKSMGWDW